MRLPDALLAPYLDAVAALNPDGTLRTYPGSPLIAGDSAAAAGSPHRLRARAGRGCFARRGASRRSPRQGGGDRRLDRAQRLRAAEGAPRPGSDRSAFRGGGRLRSPVERICGGAPQMADRHLPDVVSDQGARRRPTRLARRLQKLGVTEYPALRAHAGPAARGSGSGRLRTDRGQSAVHARAELRILMPALGGILSPERDSRIDWLARERRAGRLARVVSHFSTRKKCV